MSGRGGLARERATRPPPDPTAQTFESVVEQLCDASDAFPPGRGTAGRRPLPSRRAVEAIVDDLRAVLFPGHFGVGDVPTVNLRYAVGARLDRVQRALSEQVWRGLAFSCAHAETPRCSACGRASSAWAAASSGPRRGPGAASFEVDEFFFNGRSCLVE